MAPRDHAPAGFTIFEAILVVIIVMIIAAMLIPRFGLAISHSRVNRAANVIAAELMLSQTLAGRQHAPVTIQIRSDSMFLRISNPVTNTILRTFYFDASSDLQLDSLASTPASVQVMPNGLVTQTLVITVGSPANYYHQVTMTMAGQVRITK